MKPFFPIRSWVVPLAALLGLASVRCASDSLSSDGSGGTLVTGSGGRTGTIIDIIGIGWTGGMGGGSLDQLDPRCGEAACSPDDPSACEPFNEGGAGGEGGAAAYGGSAGLSADPGDLGNIEASCQVGLSNPDCEGSSCERVAACLPTGTQAADASCLSPADCAPGLACTDIGGTVGVCKPYCCEGGGSCVGDTYCSAAPLFGQPGLEVPVCAPLDDCSLMEPYPCPVDGECTCTGTLACGVVRPDGRTACIDPGGGEAGDECTNLTSGECAHGFVCSPTLGCMEVCQIDGSESVCSEDQLCQSPSGFPTALGVCVGLSPASP